jgi:molecular chaperone DnaJ
MFFEQVLGPCHKCNGSGKFYESLCEKCFGKGLLQKTETITLDIKKGSLFKAIVMENMGQQNDPKQKPGHLIIEVDLKKENLYDFDRNHNLLLNHFIDPVIGMVGGKVNINHPDGSNFDIHLNPYTPNGFKIKTNLQGLPKSNNEYGDLLVNFMYKTPENLEQNEIDCLNQYLNFRNARGLL